jgi:hypothetical protein
MKTLAPASSLTGSMQQNDRPTTSLRVLLVMATVFAQSIHPTASTWAQPPQGQLTVSLERSLGPGWLQAIVALPQGGYAVAGRRGPPGKWDPQATPKASVIRLNEKGSIVWEASFEGKRLALFEGLSLTPAGELVLTGFRGDGADWALSLDPSGKVLSEKSFGHPLAILRVTVMLSNGAWVSIGEDFSAGSPAKPTLFRFEPTGVFASKQAMPNLAFDDAPTPLIAPVGPNGFAVAWHAPTGKKERPRVTRFDAASWQRIWDVTIDLDPDLEPSVSTMAALPDGGLAISGMIDAHRGGASWWAAVVRADGSMQWLSRAGLSDFVAPFASAGLADGRIAVGGCAITKEAKHSMPWLAVLDAKGNVSYESIVPMQNGGAVLALSALSTGGFAAAGISGNGCALLEAGIHGANTWVRVIRSEQLDQAR